LRRREKLSSSEARRLALAAQGLAEPRSTEASDWRRLRRTVKRLGLLQIDSVNVLVRAHYLPLFSRLGPYERGMLDTKAYRKEPSALFEYWGHEASLIPMETQPLLRWRMARAERCEGIYSHIARFVRSKRAFIDDVLAEVTARGALPAAAFGERRRDGGSWWSWHDGKLALGYLFWSGQVAVARRQGGFERLYDLPERVMPRGLLDLPTPDERDAHQGLIRIAAQALGVATAGDLRDYFRQSPKDAAPAIAALVEEGALLPVTVEGWRQPAYLDATAKIPRQVGAAALLSPFDPVVWERQRTERLFDFRYRIEIYTPAEKRVHGYYVLPFLLGDRLVGRVDLKAERASSELLVHAAHAEPGTDRRAVAAALLAELRLLATWLGLERLVIGRRGALATELRAQLPTGRRASRAASEGANGIAIGEATPVPVAEAAAASAESAD
jgi:uncharacterized protein